MKILGLGNALVDIMTRLDSDNFLEAHELPKGSMQLVDAERQSGILKGAAELDKSRASGGSAANTIHGLARLGIDAGFIGKVGKDETGDFFRSDMVSSGIKPHLLESQSPSGVALALVSPDSERTFATFLGAAVELDPADLTKDHFDGYACLHIEGYLVQNNALMLKAAELSKSLGLKISIDMASFNVVDANLEFLKSYVKDYVDIVFANEEEAKSFTGLEAREALDVIADMTDVAVVKVGKEGSYIRKGDEFHKVDVDAVQALDTTGAGDLYASGFLYGIAKGLPLPACGKIGSLLAGNVIQVIGAKIPDSKWEEIRNICLMSAGEINE